MEIEKKDRDSEKYIKKIKKGTAWKTTTFSFPSEHKWPQKD